VSLNWKGKDVADAVVSAARRGMDGCLAACVRTAKSEHSFHNRTGILEGSIQIAQFAHEEDNALVGQWGSKGVKYAKAVEQGTDPYIIRNGFGRGILIHHPGLKGRPFLQPAAEKHYPELKARIKAEMP